MLREFRESGRLSCSACDFAPTPNPLRGKRESSLPYPLDFCLFCSSILWGGGECPIFRMGVHLAAFVGTFHSYLKKALSPDNNTLARGVPKGLTLPHFLATLLWFPPPPGGILPPALEWSLSPWGAQGRTQKSRKDSFQL